MKARKNRIIDEPTPEMTEELEEIAIDQAFTRMEVIYKSRCVQPPGGTNVTVQEIKKNE